MLVVYCSVFLLSSCHVSSATTLSRETTNCEETAVKMSGGREGWLHAIFLCKCTLITKIWTLFFLMAISYNIHIVHSREEVERQDISANIFSMSTYCLLQLFKLFATTFEKIFQQQHVYQTNSSSSPLYTRNILFITQSRTVNFKCTVCIAHWKYIFDTFIWLRPRTI